MTIVPTLTLTLTLTLTPYSEHQSFCGNPTEVGALFTTVLIYLVIYLPGNLPGTAVPGKYPLIRPRTLRKSISE